MSFSGVQISIVAFKVKSTKKSFSRISENWFIKTLSPKAEVISLAISLHKARSGATIIAVAVRFERKDDRMISSILLVFPTPVGS